MRIATSAKPAQERVQVMLFGVFQLLGLPDEPTAPQHAVEHPQEELQLEAENA